MIRIELHLAPQPVPQQLIFLLILSSTQYALAQPFSSPPNNYTTNSSDGSMVNMIIGISLGTLFVVSCLIISNCIRNRDTTSSTTTSNGVNATRSRGNGVDQTVIETFPLIDYATVKHMRASKSPLECAVCLSEFLDNDTLRLLPGCRHVFHTDCINTWLAQHRTCPVCRSNLSDPTVIAGKRLLSLNLESKEVASSSHVESINEGWERFTLALPEDVMKELKTAQRYRKSKSMQDYTTDRSASWGNGKIHTFINTLSWKWQGKEERNVATAPELSEASESAIWTETELTNLLPDHDRV